MSKFEPEEFINERYKRMEDNLKIVRSRLNKVRACSTAAAGAATQRTRERRVQGGARVSVCPHGALRRVCARAARGNRPGCKTPKP